MERHPRKGTATVATTSTDTSATKTTTINFVPFYIPLSAATGTDAATTT